MADLNSNSCSASDAMTLETVRNSLIRQEDTIIFSLIERAKFPLNSNTYLQNYISLPEFSGSLFEFLAKESEALHAKAGRYENPEELPFFPGDLLPPVVPPHKFPEVLHSKGASVNLNKLILDFYFNDLLPLFVAPGDDGNYASTAASDLACLLALSRRIHYGKFVAEIKFRDAPKSYEPLIRTKNKDALMELLTFKKVEEMVKKRVEKKAMVFGQEVDVNGPHESGEERKCKIDPSVVLRLYDEWIMPLTKAVEVEYLLLRLD